MDQSTVDFVLHIIPKTVADAFAGSGDLLQVLFLAILFGYTMMGAIMKPAPLGAGGAMAFTESLH